MIVLLNIILLSSCSNNNLSKIETKQTTKLLTINDSIFNVKDYYSDSCEKKIAAFVKQSIVTTITSSRYESILKQERIWVIIKFRLDGQIVYFYMQNKGFGKKEIDLIIKSIMSKKIDCPCYGPSDWEVTPYKSVNDTVRWTLVLPK